MAALRRYSIALCVVLALGTGCPNGRVDPPDDLLTDASAVLATATARVVAMRSLIVEARASYYSSQGARKGKLIILARRPASLHFSALSPTDDMIAVLASDGARFTSFERGATSCQTGRACPENVGRLVPLALEGQQVVQVLFGGAPLIDAFERSVVWDGSVGAYRVTLRGDEGVEDVWVNHGSGLVRRALLRRGDTVVFDIVFEDVEHHGAHALPHTIQVRMSRGDVDLKLRYRQVDVDEPIGDDAFALPCPEGTIVQELRCSTP